MSHIKARVWELAGEYGYKTDTDLAHAMGVSIALVSRVRRGQRRINQVFIAGALRAFPNKSLDELFTVEPETEAVA